MKYAVRLVCLALSLALLAGCAPIARPTRDAGAQQLVVEDAPPQYSEAFERETADRLAKLLSALSRRGGGPLADEKRLAELSGLLRERIFPQARLLLIYERDWTGLLAASEAALALYDDKALPAAELAALLARLYGAADRALGTERAGGLWYYVIDLALQEKQALAEQRYEKYGYSWYLEEAQRYAALTGRWQTALDAPRLAQAMAVVGAYLPALFTLLRDGLEDEESLPLYDAELLSFVRRQSAKGVAALTPTEWELMGEMMAGLLPSVSGNDALAVEWRVLSATDGYLSALFGVMPSLLSLCLTAAEGLTVEQVTLLRKEADPAARAALLARTLLGCEPELAALHGALSSRAASDTVSERAALESAGLLADYEAFAAERTALSLEGLLTALADVAAENVGKIDTVAALSAALTDYFYGFAPYLTYALCRAAAQGEG